MFAVVVCSTVLFVLLVWNGLSWSTFHPNFFSREYYRGACEMLWNEGHANLNTGGCTHQAGILNIFLRQELDAQSNANLYTHSYTAQVVPPENHCAVYLHVLHRPTLECIGGSGRLQIPRDPKWAHCMIPLEKRSAQIAIISSPITGKLFWTNYSRCTGKDGPSGSVSWKISGGTHIYLMTRSGVVT